MKKIIGIGLATVWLGLSPALAQQQQQGDPALNACQQLLGSANANIIQIAAQATMLSRQLDDAKAELAKPKADKPNG